MVHNKAVNGPMLAARHLARVIRGCTSAAALLYTVSFVAWRGVLLTPLHDRIWHLELSEVFAVWFYTPTALLAVAALVFRSRLGWALLVPLVWFGLEYGSQFAPQWPAANASVPTLRVMTWNTRNSPDRHQDFIATVRDIRPDLIALQEVDFGLKASLDDLADEWPYQSVYLGGSRGGMALLSRFPVRDAEMHYDLFSCQCMEAVVEWEGRPVQVVSVHLWRPTFEMELHDGWPWISSFSTAHQDRTFDLLLEKVASAELPVLAVGDFNTTELQPNYRRLRLLLENAWEGGGWGLGHTFPARGRYRWLPAPMIRIDHIWHDPAWRTVRAWTGLLEHSDHLYVVADLAAPASP